MDDEDIESLVERAGKIADAAPAPLKNAAFATVLQFLLVGGEAAGPKRRRPRKPARESRRPSKRATTTKAPAKKAAKATTAKKSSSSRRPGPKAAVEALVSGGFLKTPRTNKAMREQLRLAKGWTYAATDLSPTLVRMLRDGTLTREKNSDGQYEFQTG